jgi:glycerate 2-kinase
MQGVASSATLIAGVLMVAKAAKAAPRSSIRAELLRIYAAAISAVDAHRVIARAFEGNNAGVNVPAIVEQASGIYLLAVGKAALGMAAGAERHIGAKIRDALAIVPGPPPPDAPRNVRVMTGAHPLPDASSEAAGRAALEFVARVRPGELVMLALSGGASALMAVPAGDLTLADKIAITSGLMRAGASIRELNAVRKHLSAIKGGRLLRVIAPDVRVLSLILSDVAGNDLATVGSGPASADPTTFSDAVAILKRRGLWGRAPEAIRDHLERGSAGEIDETLKVADPALTRVSNIIVGDNRTALDAAAEAAASLGYEVERWRELTGEANDAGRMLAAHLCGIEHRRVCVIAGGEPTVTVRGPGKGGRAQQCALAMAIELARIGAARGLTARDFRVAAIVAGTDGIDGPTDAAGAIVNPATLMRAAEAGLIAQTFLDRNDAYALFAALGDLVITGPTGTNVGDIFVGLVN